MLVLLGWLPPAELMHAYLEPDRATIHVGSRVEDRSDSRLLR